MVMRADVLARAVDAVAPAGDPRPRLAMSPRGVPLTPGAGRGARRGPGAVILCGRFEGVDERVIEGRGFEEISIGDYVLSGGEVAAFVLLDACVRLLPGVMGKEAPARRRASPRACSNTRIYAAAALGGPRDPRRAHLRRPRQGRGLAPRRGRAAHPRAPARPLGGPSGAVRRRAERQKRAGREARPDGGDKEPPRCRRSSPDPHKRDRAPFGWRCPMETSHEPDSGARERADRKAFRRQGDSGFWARRHGARQRQGGGGRAHPHPGL